MDWWRLDDEYSQFDGGAEIQNFSEWSNFLHPSWRSHKTVSKLLLDASKVEVVEVISSDSGKPLKLEYLVNGFAVFNNKDEKKIAAK